MKWLQVLAITLIVLTGARAMSCEKNSRGQQQSSSNSTTEQVKK
jgi:hypothetical protein